MPQNYEFFSVWSATVTYCYLLLLIVIYCYVARSPVWDGLSGSNAEFRRLPPRAFWQCGGANPLPVPVGNGWKAAEKQLQFAVSVAFPQKSKSSASELRCRLSGDAVKEISPAVGRRSPPQCDCVVAAACEIAIFLVFDLRVLCQWLASG